MQIYLWPSFSSNNSSSFSLVAEFSSESVAADVAAELADFFAAHAKQVDAFEDYEERLSEAQIALAEKHDIAWATDAPLYWGEVELVGDEPEVAAAEKKVVVYHGYCGGGLDLQPYLEARGAVDMQFGEETPTVTARFGLPAGQLGAEIREQLETFFGQDAPKLSDWKQGPPWSPQSNLPWQDIEEAACYCDTEVAMFHLPISLRDLDALRDYFARNEIEDYQLTLCDTTELQRLRRLSIAKQCPECKSRSLKLFADVSAETKDQIACLDCGGMFDLMAIEAAPRPLTKLSDEHVHDIDGVGDVVFAAAGMYLGGEIWRLGSDDRWEMVKTTERGLRGIHVSSATRAIVVGTRGTILCTTDGRAWSSRKSGTYGCLYSVAQTPDGRLFISGDGGVILCSANQGKTWTQIETPTRVTRQLFHVAAVSSDLLFSVGANGVILRSTDGGNAWQRQPSHVEESLCRVLALDDQNLVVVGDLGIVLTSSNGGRKWVRRSSETESTIEDVALGNDGRLYAVTSSGDLLVSEDGKKWASLPSGTQKPLRGIYPSPSGVLYLVGNEGTLVKRDDLDCPATPGDHSAPLGRRAGLHANAVPNLWGPSSRPSPGRATPPKRTTRSWWKMLSQLIGKTRDSVK